MAADTTAGKALAGVAALGVVEDSLAEALDGIGTGRVLSRAQLSMWRKCLTALRRARVRFVVWAALAHPRQTMRSRKKQSRGGAAAAVRED